MKPTPREDRQPAAIVAGSNRSQQAADTRDQWNWVEPTVWTSRMLARLAASEPTTVWFRLWDKVIGKPNLQNAFWKVWRNQGSAGVDGQSVRQFEERLDMEMERLSRELHERSYRRQPARRKWIDKPGTTEKRPLGIPTVRDRTVEAAVRNVIEPIFEHDFCASSYGFRPGRSCQQAVAKVEEWLRGGRVWCVDADLKSYFDTIPHHPLMERIRKRVVDGNVLALVEQSLKAGVLEELKGWESTKQGTPQGAVISPLLANIYLHPMDQEMERRGWALVRYADDLVVLCRSQEEAQEVMNFLSEWTQAAGLTLHPTKTRIVNAVEEGFDFLGWHFRGTKKWPREKSLQKLREKLKPLSRRTQGGSFQEIVSKLNRTLRGWYGYFRYCHPVHRHEPDAWLRRRLRAMLRKREKRPGYGRSEADSRRWPNRWFAKQGLFSLEHGSCNYG